jgi:hypothetical protein
MDWQDNKEPKLEQARKRSDPPQHPSNTPHGAAIKSRTPRRWENMQLAFFPMRKESSRHLKTHRQNRCSVFLNFQTKEE